MSDMNPRPLSPEDWKQIMAVPAVREAWGLEDDEKPSDFAGTVYTAKFNFVSGSPGYFGDLYILQGDALNGFAARGGWQFACVVNARKQKSGSKR